MNVSNMTLVKIASVGGLATITMALLFRSKVQENIRATPFYKEALKSVRTHPGAVNLLGEPIKAKSIDIDKQEVNFCKENKAQYVIPLKGMKQNGKLYLWAERVNEEALWNINKLELEVEKIPDKRLIIKRL